MARSFVDELVEFFRARSEYEVRGPFLIVRTSVDDIARALGRKPYYTKRLLLGVSHPVLTEEGLLTVEVRGSEVILAMIPQARIGSEEARSEAREGAGMEEPDEAVEGSDN